MPKRLKEFTREDWKRLRPVTQSIKTVRYRATNEIYVRLPARLGDVEAAVRAVRGRNVLVTIAFNDPQLIDWQLRLVRRYVTHDVCLVADNSHDETAADAIEKAARAAGALYVRLPRNFSHESRSHGLALNWVWQNILRLGAPTAFGFLDHDLFPTQPDDPFAVLATQDFYGIVRHAPPRWFLWAGFCFFNFAAIGDKPVNFGQDWFVGLDTGGGNWEPLYQHAELDTLRQAPIENASYSADVAIADSHVQWSNGWLHEVGIGWLPDARRSELKVDKRRAVTAMLAEHLSG